MEIGQKWQDRCRHDPPAQLIIAAKKAIACTVLWLTVLESLYVLAHESTTSQACV